MWTAAVSKRACRCAGIAKSGAPAAAMAELHNTRAPPISLYLAQFGPPPDGFAKRETRVVCHMLHLHTFGTCWHVELPELGGPAFGSVRAHACSVSLRAAVSMSPRFSKMFSILRRAHAPVATLEQFGGGVWWRIWWDTRPIVAHLEDTVWPCCRSQACPRALGGSVCIAAPAGLVLPHFGRGCQTRPLVGRGLAPHGGNHYRHASGRRPRPHRWRLGGCPQGPGPRPLRHAVCQKLT